MLQLGINGFGLSTNWAFIPAFLSFDGAFLAIQGPIGVKSSICRARGAVDIRRYYSILCIVSKALSVGKLGGYKLM